MPDPRKYRQIYAALKAEIDSGGIPPGTVLHINELRERFGASRNTVRHALNELAADHSVWLSDGVGWYTGPGPEDPPDPPEPGRMV